MFYQEEMDNALRFGDVLRGFILTSPIIKNPGSVGAYEIAIRLPPYCVVLSPCCSIGHKVISLSPLIEIRPSFFDNPYFEEDLTRINRKMEPQQAVSPHVWEKFPLEVKQERLKEGYGYGLFDVFIYEKHDLLPKYTVNRRQGNIETNYYMVDFKNIYKINCGKIISAENAPLDAKYLQLSIQTRSELRDKIAYYYARIPKEDRIFED